MDEKLEKALQETCPTLAVLYRPGDEDCEEMAPVLEEVKTRLAGKANVIDINGTENQDLIREYKVAAYPAYLLFKDGELVWHDYGRKSFGELEHMLREFI